MSGKIRIQRKSYAKIPDVLEFPHLIEMQIRSYEKFLQKDVPPEQRARVGLQAIFEEIFPITGYDNPSSLEFVEYSIGEPKFDVYECRRRGLTYAAPLKVKFRLVVREWDENGQPIVRDVREQEVYMGEVPLITDKGTFVINGAERVIVSQLHRSPGVYFEQRMHQTGRRLYSARIIPYRGAWIDVEFDHNDIIHINVDRRRRLPITLILRALGMEKDADIIRTFCPTQRVRVDQELEGKIPVEDVLHPETGEVLAKGKEKLTQEALEALQRAGVEEIEIIATDDEGRMVILQTLKVDPEISQDEALLEIYKRLRPGEPPTLENARVLFDRQFFNPRHFDLARVGRFKINRKLNLDISPDTTVLTKEDFIGVVRYLINLRCGDPDAELDDIDHLGNRRVRSVGELVQNQVRIGFARLERLVRERMSVLDMDQVMPQHLINPKLVAAAIKDFFARSQLSQFMDQTNPLSELTHKRRLSALGPGGLTRERASFEVRDVHFSHYGRICPIETPEGPNIGLISSLSTYARVNEFGFIETPYRRVEDGRVTDKIEYLSADVEADYIIAQANVKVDEEGKIIDEFVFARYRGEFIQVPPKEVQYIDVSPRQLVSVSTGLIPFLEHDDPTRALMGSNMQRQAVPLMRTEAPLIGTGLEHTAAKDSGATVIARKDGVVVDVSADMIVVQCDDGTIERYRLRKFERSNQNTCINQQPIVVPGDRVRAGEVIADGPATKDGELALGRNVLVAFMPWGGYNFEDAILVSERLVKDDVYTSVHIEELEIEARDTKLGREEITRDIPNVSEDALKNLDETGIIRIGAEVKPGDILVGKVTPKSETELTPEEKLLRAIFGEKAADVRDASLVAPPGLEGIVVDVKVFSRKEKEEDEKDKAFEKREVERIEEKYAREIDALRRARNHSLKSLLIGKTLAEDVSKGKKTLFKKGTLIDEEVFEQLLSLRFEGVAVKEDEKAGERVREILRIYEEAQARLEANKLEEIEQVKRGDELPPGVIKLVKVYVACKRKLSVGDKMAGRHGNKGVVSKILPEEDMPYLPDGTPVDIVLNPLGVPSRMNVGQILETHLGWAAKALGLYITSPIFSGATEEEIKQTLREAGLPESGTTVLYDGRTGEPFHQEVTVGYIYILKLAHLVEDKVHARAIGPYSLVTQQPLGGKAQFGGQRFGEMEVWALEAYGAAYTLQEILTVKSDDVVGRTRIYESIVKGDNSLEPGLPESFNVLVKELQGLGLDVRLIRHEDDGRVVEFSGLSEIEKENVRKGVNAFDAIKIGIASPETIRSWSHGEVKKPETINYRTFKPERDGLFCERIFGPTKDWECACGKYKRIKHKGMVCDRCGVEITQSKVRRERMGHINLACPVSHIWFLKVAPGIMGNLLGMSIKALERIIYYEAYVVIDPGKTPLKYKQLLTDADYKRYKEEYGEDAFVAKMGAEAVKELLQRLDLDALVEELKREVQQATSRQKRQKVAKRLRIVEQFRNSGNKPEWMILETIAVIPPDLRPLVPLDGGRFATSDLNDLYRRVINRNERLKHLLKLSAPDVIIRNEKRMLQEAVDALFDNGRHGRPVLGPGNRPLKSLSDMLRGKQGRFRQNLLGKRVDYSGRSVIVIGPELKLHQCGLPKKMALELFEPFIINKLREKGLVHTIKSAKRMVERVRPEVWDILEEVIEGHPVLLNRAPTLHRLGIQAFEPVLIEGKAIQIHPLVCTAYNADFDGDQMAVHIPLSNEAQLESKLLMMSTNNLFSPANGEPIVVPTQDIVLGCYYLTKERRGAYGEGKIFASPTEAEYAYWVGEVSLHARVKVWMNGHIVDTTVGRVIFNERLPKGLPHVNEVVDKSRLSELIKLCYNELGHDVTVEFLDVLKEIGFEWSTLGGISIAMEDMTIPPEKEKIIHEAWEKVAEVEEQYKMGIITSGERYNKVVDIWSRASDVLSDLLFEQMAHEHYEDVPIARSPRRGNFNPIFMMADSGARGSKLQIRQLAGMRGLMAKPSGEIIETPIISNFREGLTVLEYFISTHGARKGLADTALKTADSGYLTRRLVDVAQDVIVTEEDCGTLEGVSVRGMYEGEEIVIPLKERIVGRYAVEDIVIPHLGEVIVKAGEEISEEAAEAIEEAGIEEVKIRSVLTCEAKRGVCAKCYGRDLARQRLVELGTAVGIIAAQSIGEPGTQLTMRTFHIGGTASMVAERSKIEVRHGGVVRFHSVKWVENRAGQRIVLNRSGYFTLHDDEGRELERHFLMSGSVLHVEDGERVEAGSVLAEWDPYTTSIVSEVGGRVRFEDFVPGVTVREELDETTGLKGIVVMERLRENYHPQIVILDDKGEIQGYYSVPAGAHVLVREGDEVAAGDVLAKTPRQIVKTRDITGGLPRVAELFEARRPKDPAIISEIEGIVEFGGTSKGMRKIIVRNEETGMEKVYLIPPGKHLNVSRGDRVYAGQPLVDGPIVPHDILRVQGPKAVQQYLLNEIQQVYRLQGVKINDKHIEIIIRQMMRKVEVTEPGDTRFLPGEQVDKFVFQEENERVQKEGGKPAEGRQILQGITKASLTTESWISAASFQQTTSVLTEAAAAGKVDELRGLKEVVVNEKVGKGPEESVVEVAVPK